MALLGASDRSVFALLVRTFDLRCWFVRVYSFLACPSRSSFHTLFEKVFFFLASSHHTLSHASSKVLPQILLGSTFFYTHAARGIYRDVALHCHKHEDAQAERD
jgi:hypothetical protein